MSQSLICTTAIDATVTPAICSSGWQAVDTALGFDIAQLDPSAVLSAFVAGASVCFVPLSIAWACSFLLHSIQGR